MKLFVVTERITHEEGNCIKKNVIWVIWRRDLSVGSWFRTK